DGATGKVQAEPLPLKPKPAQASKLTPAFGRRGEKVRVTVEGMFLDDVTEAVVAHPGTVVTVAGKSPQQVQLDLSFPATTPAGAYPLTLKSAAGTSTALSFTVAPFAAVTEREPNNTAGTGQKLTLSATVAGTLGQAGDVDFYRFEMQAGQQL